MNQPAGQSPHLLLGKMLAYYRTCAGLTPEQLGALVYLSGSQIRKVENGNRTLTADLAKACENIRELGCNGALTELLDLLGEQLKRRPFPGWFEGWPEKEAQAKRLRDFEPLVVPGLLQTEDYARAILSTRLDSPPMRSSRRSRVAWSGRRSWSGTSLPSCRSFLTKGPCAVPWGVLTSCGGSSRT